MRKIINITVFALAGLAALLSLIFAINFDQDTSDKFNNTIEVQASNPQMITDLSNATIETLPGFKTKYEAILSERNADLKAQKIQRDIFYTFIYQLGEITDQESFENFKAKFPQYSKSLFAKAENKDFYINGFNKVNSYANFNTYYKSLQNEYNEVNQKYLFKISAIKAETSLFKQVDDINSAISVTKKQHDLSVLQKNVKSYKSGSTEFNITMNLFYLFFFVTFAAMLIFLFWNVFVNIKSNYLLLLGVGAIVLLVFFGYFISSPELTSVAIREKFEPSQMKWVGAGLFTFYCAFFGAIAAILITLTLSSIKKAK